MRLDRQITIEVPVQTKGATGAPETTWEPLSTLGSPPVAERYWAQVRDARPSRSEAVRTGLQVARDQVVVTMRWRDDVTSAMRVTIHGDTGGDRVTQIVGGPAEVGGRKKYLEMVVEEYSTCATCAT